MSASAIARHAFGARAVRLAERDAVAFGVADHAGLGDFRREIDDRADHAARIDGLRRSRRRDRRARAARPENSPAPVWKYHQGMPFCVLTTVVSAPSSGASCGASCVRPCAFTPRKMTSTGPASSRSPMILRLHFEIAFGAEHAHAALLHGAQMRAAREERDVLAGARHARADVSRRSRRRRRSGISLLRLPRASRRTAPRWILPVAVRGIASTM